MTHGIRILCLLATFLLSGCGSRPDPVADAKRAIAAGDRRLVGYMGVGLVVPGTPAGFQRFMHAPGVRVLPNIDDTKPAASEEARKYASEYNQVVLGDAGSDR